MNLQDLSLVMAAFAASGASELVLEANGVRLELRKSRAPQVAGVAASAPQAPASVNSPAPGTFATGPAATASGAASASSAGTQVARASVPAPADGVFYRAPSPGAPPFVQEGDAVQAGQVLGLIEVMKMMAEVRSPAAGVVRAVLVENGATVQAGQPLLELEVGAGVGG